jgi:uncharacterized membrane protein
LQTFKVSKFIFVFRAHAVWNSAGWLHVDSFNNAVISVSYENLMMRLQYLINEKKCGGWHSSPIQHSVAALVCTEQNHGKRLVLREGTRI